MNQSHEKSIITIYYILGAIQPAKQVDLDISIQCRRHNVHAENSPKHGVCNGVMTWLALNLKRILN